LLNTGIENGSQWIPAEVDVSIRPGWFYHSREDSLVKTPEKLFDIYLTSVGRGSTLLLNVPPDRRGLIHENDVKALKEWRAMLDREFKANLAKDAEVNASAERGSQFSASNVNDNNKETYWSTADDVTTGSLEINFKEEKEVRYVMIQEYIRLGQRVKAFTIETWKENAWQKVTEGTTIGYKRILKVDPVQTERIRISITDSKACPVISNVEIF
jgi:alpha-L-fucosidase